MLTGVLWKRCSYGLCLSMVGEQIDNFFCYIFAIIISNKTPAAHSILLFYFKTTHWVLLLYFDSCGEHAVNTQQTTKIIRSPTVLITHVKRYNSNGQKIQKHIKVDRSLSIQTTVRYITLVKLVYNMSFVGCKDKYMQYWWR